MSTFVKKKRGHLFHLKIKEEDSVVLLLAGGLLTIQLIP